MCFWRCGGPSPPRRQQYWGFICSGLLTFVVAAIVKRLILKPYVAGLLFFDHFFPLLPSFPFYLGLSLSLLRLVPVTNCMRRRGTGTAAAASPPSAAIPSSSSPSSSSGGAPVSSLCLPYDPFTRDRQEGTIRPHSAASYLRDMWTPRQTTWLPPSRAAVRCDGGGDDDDGDERSSGLSCSTRSDDDTWLDALPCVAGVLRNFSDSSASDAWRMAAVTRIPMAFGDVAVLLVNVRWVDQGWGNRKGRLLFGGGPTNCVTEEPAEHTVQTVRRVYVVPRVIAENTASPIVKDRDGQLSVVLSFVTGGGGGHSLHVHHLSWMVIPRQGASFYEYVHLFFRIKRQLREEKDVVAATDMALLLDGNATDGAERRRRGTAASSCCSTLALIVDLCGKLADIPIAVICRYLVPVDLRAWFLTAAAAEARQ